MPAKLALKLSRVLGKVSRVPKNGTNTFHNYKYATESDVADSLRQLLSEEKIFIFPSIEDVSDMDKDRAIVRVKMRFTFVDGESGESFSTVFFGDAQDLGSKGRGDKGIYKAITGCEKYMQMKTFMIASGDDPEQSGPSEQAKESKQKDAPKSAKQIFSEATKNTKWTKDQLKEYGKLKYGVDSSSALSPQQMIEFSETITALFYEEATHNLKEAK